MSGMFAGIEEAKPSFDSNYMRRGHYYALINRVKADADKTGSDFLAVEMTILHVFPDGDGADVQDEKGREKYEYWHSVHEDASQLYWKKYPSFLGNVKSFIANVMGVVHTEVTEEDCEAACDPDRQPMAGYVVELRNRLTTTQAKGNPFTRVNFVREVMPEEYLEFLDPEIVERYFPADENTED